MMRGERIQSTGFDEGPQLDAEAPEGEQHTGEEETPDFRPGEEEEKTSQYLHDQTRLTYLRGFLTQLPSNSSAG